LTKPLVIGFGNSLRHDDGLGCRAAELMGVGADVVVVPQLTPELALEMRGRPLIVFLDAAVDLMPGEVRTTGVTAQEPGRWSHTLTPGQLLGMVEEIGASCGPAYLASGGALDLSAGEGLSECGERCAREIAERANWLIAKQWIRC
jgi:hydrogenase maturation protease